MHFLCTGMIFYTVRNALVYLLSHPANTYISMNCILIDNFSLCVFDATRQVETKTDAQLKNEQNLADNKAKGELSKKARSRLLKGVSNLIGALETGQKHARNPLKSKQHELTFVTLTLPSKQVHDDEFIKRHCLTYLISQLQAKKLCAAYLWKAEKQNNGNIHFHLLIPNYIPHSYLRKVWNGIMERHGYIQAYRERMKKWHYNGFKVRKDLLGKWSETKQRAAYETGKKEEWSNPNTTDIHQLRTIKNTKAYIAKYIGKNESEKQHKVSGHLWGRSDNIDDLLMAQDLMNQEYTNELLQLEAEDYVKRIDKDFCTIFQFNNCKLTDFIRTRLYEKYKLQCEINYIAIFQE